MPDPLPPLAVVPPYVANVIMRRISSEEWRRLVVGAEQTNPAIARELKTAIAYLRQGAAWWGAGIEARASSAGNAEMDSAEIVTDSESPSSLDTASVADSLRVSDRRVRQLCDSEVLKADKVNGRWAIDPESLDMYKMRSRT